jgi:DNA-binding NarL/FixJ family response regulator
MNQFSIGIVDDHKIVRDGIRLMLLDHSSCKLTLEADNVVQMLDKLKSHQPDLLILDLNLPGTSGLDIIDVLRTNYPEMKILILSANYDEYSILTAIERGVHGYVSKDSDSDELILAIETILAGDEFFAEKVSRIVYLSFLMHTKSSSISVFIDENNFLSDRETEVLRCFADGMSYKQVADHLNISPRTVETHRMNIMSKLGLESLAHLVKYAIKNGIVSL